MKLQTPNGKAKDRCYLPLRACNLVYRIQADTTLIIENIHLSKQLLNGYSADWIYNAQLITLSEIKKRVCVIHVCIYVCVYIHVFRLIRMCRL